MDQYITGAVVKELRTKNRMTQAELADRLSVSDKAISKWETGKGYPDISLLEPIAAVFGISVTELLSGNAVSNSNVSANMLRTKIYVCPVCGNVIFSAGEAAISCHGISLLPSEAEQPDDHHQISVERIEDEYYVQIDHDMTKSHYISFIAGISYDRVELVKLYPEGPAECRIRMRGLKKICYYCNKEGLYYKDL